MQKRTYTFGKIARSLLMSAAFIGGMLFLQVFFAVLFTAFKMGVTGGAPADPDRLVQPVLIVSGLATVCGCMLFYRLRGESPFYSLALRPVRVRDMAPVVMLGVGMHMVIALAFVFLPIPEEALTDYARASEALEYGTPILKAAASVLVAPLMEELVFRSLVLKHLRQAMPAWLAVLLSSLAFGAVHGNLLWMLYASVLGVLCALVYLKFDSVIPSILLHAGFNAAGMLLEALNLRNTYLAVIVCLLFVLVSPVWIARIKPRRPPGAA
ncbi:MAG: CPBP family intramembrane glutamic endopeptidase [Christensenellales bacterium]|jgi:membrane protease YdiL (CAAX protease family)